MSTSQHENTVSRRQALQVLYRRELMNTSLTALDADVKQGTVLLIPECPEGAAEFDLIGTELADYAKDLLGRIEPHLDQIDAWISEVAQNWTLSRMPIVDRNIIRLAVFEIAYCDDIPTGVAINEAVELAKAFGGDESPRFVNGVLGRIALRFDSADEE